MGGPAWREPIHAACGYGVLALVAFRTDRGTECRRAVFLPPRPQ